MQGERQDVDFPVTVKNDVVKLTTSLFRDANERTESRQMKGEVKVASFFFMLSSGVLAEILSSAAKATDL